MSVIIDPNLLDDGHRISLTADESAWIDIGHLPDRLIDYGTTHFKKLFNLRPQSKGQVVMFNRDVSSQRWHKSYGETPQYDADRAHSYMFSSISQSIRNPVNQSVDQSISQPGDQSINQSADQSINQSTNQSTLPIEFMVFLDHVNQGQEIKFNQVIVNWYANGSDNIAAHSDCTLGMVPRAAIVIYTLENNQSINQSRTFRLMPILSQCDDYLYKECDILTRHGSIISMSSMVQDKFRHTIVKEKGECNARISITFRKYITTINQSITQSINQSDDQHINQST